MKLMLSIKSDETGSFFVWLLLIGVVVLWGMFWLYDQRSNDVNLFLENQSVAEESIDNSDQSITRSFSSVNGYDASGKVVIEEDEFSNFTMRASLAMPAEFTGTNYFAKLIGKGANSDEEIGKLEKTGGVYSFRFSSFKSLEEYTQVVIYVDGTAATVEGKTLPHDVLVMSL